MSVAGSASKGADHPSTAGTGEVEQLRAELAAARAELAQALERCHALESRQTQPNNDAISGADCSTADGAASAATNGTAAVHDIVHAAPQPTEHHAGDAADASPQEPQRTAMTASDHVAEWSEPQAPSTGSREMHPAPKSGTSGTASGSGSQTRMRSHYSSEQNRADACTGAGDAQHQRTHEYLQKPSNGGERQAQQHTADRVPAVSFVDSAARHSSEPVSTSQLTTLSTACTGSTWQSQADDMPAVTVRHGEQVETMPIHSHENDWHRANSELARIDAQHSRAQEMQRQQHAKPPTSSELETVARAEAARWLLDAVHASSEQRSTPPSGGSGSQSKSTPGNVTVHKYAERAAARPVVWESSQQDGGDSVQAQMHQLRAAAAVARQQAAHEAKLRRSVQEDATADIEVRAET